MLAGHPQLFSPPEMLLAPFETMEQRENWLQKRYWEKGGLRRALIDLHGVSIDEAKSIVQSWQERSVSDVYLGLQEACGDRMLVDKCPHLCVDDGALERLSTQFPNARFLWIIRHPGSVTRSLENMPMAEVMLQGYGGTPDQIWEIANRRIQRFLEHASSHRQASLRYEALVAHPEDELKRICSALEIDFVDSLCHPYEGDRMREGPKGARAIGDPNMAGRGRIDPNLAHRWLDSYDPRRASPETRSLAASLGYDFSELSLPGFTQIGDAMQQLWSTAAKLEASIHVPQELDAIEGRRFLMRMLTASIETFVEYNDPDRPVFHSTEGPTRKMFADCPDTDYLRAPIRLGDGRVYRIRGRIPPGTLYVGVLYYRRGGAVGNFLDDRSISCDSDGQFEILLSTEALDESQPFLLGQGDETAIMIRQYYTDRSQQAPIQVAIDYLGQAGPAPSSDATTLARQVQRSERMLKAVVERTLQASNTVVAMALNRFIEIPGEALFPTPDNTYQVCWYRFGYNQIMLVRGTLPECRYF